VRKGASPFWNETFTFSCVLFFSPFYPLFLPPTPFSFAPFVSSPSFIAQ
jgi:hypothetical protein